MAVDRVNPVNPKIRVNPRFRQNVAMILENSV